MKLRVARVIVGFLSLALSLTPLTFGQTSAQTASALPRLVRFGGTVKDLNGSPMAGVVGITFALYSEKTGGAPLWLETQNATADNNGHYTVLLGSTKPEGLPADLFTSEQAHWVGVQLSGQAEQPRVLLVSAPYALKAGDAETIGGLPPSAFVLAAPANSGGAIANGSGATDSSSASLPPPASSDVTTTGGTMNAIPLFFTATSIQNSLLTQTGTAAVNVGGKLNLPATAAATKTVGADSRPLDFVASSFSSTSSTALNQTFQWQAEPAANDTTAPSGTLNLLYGLGPVTPTETGLKLSNKGVFTFATGQTFPGTGDGSVTSVATGLGLKGGPIIKTGTLTIDTTVVPQLKAANTFTAEQTITSTNTTQILHITQSGTGGGIGATSTSGPAVGGVNTTGGSFFPYGVLGVAQATSGGGVFGWASASSGATLGVSGESDSTAGIGVQGTGGTGVVGVSSFASGPGGNFTGFSVPSGSGLSGTDGIVGAGGNGDPTVPMADDTYGGAGIYATGGTGIFNLTSEGQLGGDGPGGVFTGGNSGNPNNNKSVPHGTGDGIDVYPGSGLAGYFQGDVEINGTIYTGAKDFKIDHPLDPANKYLFHSSVESSEMMNIYTGNVTTDGQGQATVQLPEWFEVLNTDFRYQLTVIGQFAQAIVAREIENNQFEIRTSTPNVKVSWQVTGVRQDAYAKAHPLVVEQEKEARLRGFYIHPELYGAPAEKQIEWARHPQMMKRIKEMQAKQLAASQKPAVPQSAPQKN